MGASASLASAANPSTLAASGIPISAAVAGKMAARKSPGNSIVTNDLKLLEDFWRLESSTLTSLSYCQIRDPKKPDTQDFLILQMNNRRNLYIRAEKVHVGQETGIRISRAEEFPVCQVLQVIYMQIKIGLSDVLDVLLDHDPSYNAFTNNGWNYALGTAIRLLAKLSSLLGSDSEKKKLEEEGKALDAAVRKNHYEGDGKVAYLAATAVGYGDELGGRLQNMVPKIPTTSFPKVSTTSKKPF